MDDVGFKKNRHTRGAGMMNDSSTLRVPVAPVSPIAQLAQIPEEKIWLSKQKSARKFDESLFDFED